jgi:gliding motility-associated-like protein
MVMGSHVKGGWMSYRFLGKEQNGNLRYEITIKLYRSCDDDGPNDPRLSVSLFRTGNPAVIQNYTAPNTRTYDLNKVSFHPCLSPVPLVCYTIKEYQTTISVPEIPEGYTIASQGCCRVSGIRNLEPPTRLSGYTYTSIIPGNQTNPGFVENNSPLFVEKDTVALCRNTRFDLDFGANDADGDSLVFQLAPALAGSSQGVPSAVPTAPPPFPALVYQTGYSGENPLGGPIEINPQTGLISGIAPDITGEFVISIILKEYRNGRLISTSRKELHVNVANCSIPEAELPVEQINCDSFVMNFENTASSPAVLSYYWDFGAPGNPNNISTLPTPTFTFPDSGTYLVKLVVNRGNVCSDSAFSLVKIFPGFKPGFQTNGACFNIPIQFTDTSKVSFGQITSWQWNFGDPLSNNNLSTLQNPAHQFSSSGTFPISLRIISNKGCDKSITVPVNILDVANLSLAFSDTLICGRDSVQLEAIGSGNFVWTPNNGTISNPLVANPVVFPQSSTTYVVQLSDNGCSDTDSIRVNVISSFTVNAGADTTICLGDSAQLQATASLVTTFSWAPAANIDNPAIGNPIVWPILPANAFIVTATFGKCSEKDTIVVRTVPYPVSNAGDNSIVCFGQSVTLNGSGSGNRFQWSPSSGLSNPNSAITQASPAQTTLYTLIVYDDRGCPKPGISSVLVNVAPPIQIFAGRDTIMVVGQAIQLNAISTGTSHFWTPATGLSATNSLSPVLTLHQSMIPQGSQYLTYKITSTNTAGCQQSDEIVIRVFSTGPSIFVPTAFTPNNDGLNDKIKPILAGIRQLEYFRIFNRYGQIVFESKNPENAWDGSVKGKPQLSGNYIFQVHAIDLNGDVVKLNGSFVLIR